MISTDIADVPAASASVVLDAPSREKWWPGFYRIHARLEGGVAARRLRLISGRQQDGSPEHQPLATSDADGRLSSFFVLGSPTVRLEIQAEDGGPTPRLAEIDVKRISRREAIIGMLLDLREDGGRPLRGKIPAAVVAMLLAVMRSGSRMAGDVLVGRYRYGLRSPMQRRAVKALVSPGVLQSLQAEWIPVNQLAPASDDDASALWVARGNDPQFQLTHAGGPCFLPAGWYRLSMRLRQVAGRVASPCLYPDFGDGAAQDETMSLPEPDREGSVQTLLMFRSPVTRLRLDPTIDEATFHFEGFQLRRVGRIRALLAMLSVMRTPAGAPDWRMRIAAGLGFLRTALSAGVPEAARRLFLAYQDLQSPRSYAEWVRRYDSRPSVPRDPSVSADGPLVSILVPVYNTPGRWLRRCIESVLQQEYPHWELCIADDASPDTRVRTLLQEYRERDPRIRVHHRARNGHISAASNTALDMARGQYIALLDHDDELRPHALAEMVEALAAHPGARLLYSDEDKIDDSGRRFHPYFKPDWNPDLLRSQNYLCHFTMIETSLVREVGGFRHGFEGSQDHDLFLRCVERLKGTQIHHVPKVLYHWRAIEGSTAHVREAKDYAAEAGLRAVAEHLERIGSGASVDLLEHGHYRVRWPVPHPAPRVSLIIPTRDRVDLLRTCVESVLGRTDYPDFEIVVIDNQSSESDALAYLASLRGRERLRVLSFDAPFNYSAINNWGVSQCSGQVICLLNNDIEVINGDWLTEMVGHALRPEVGAVGAMLYYPDDTIQHAGVLLGIGGVANHAYAGQPRGYPGHGARALVTQNLSSVTGACLVMRREVFERVGGLDEGLKVAFNDVDLCLRLCEAGYRNVWTPFAELYHHESASRGRDDLPEKRERFLSEVRCMEARWGGLLQRDPAYNPNLSLASVNSDFAFPPRGA